MLAVVLVYFVGTLSDELTLVADPSCTSAPSWPWFEWTGQRQEQEQYSDFSSSQFYKLSVIRRDLTHSRREMEGRRIKT